MTRIVVFAFLAFGATACTTVTDRPDAGVPTSTDGAAAAEMPDSTRTATPAGELAAGLELPATFAGTLPCADCPGIRYRLNLWPDGVFHLHREWLDRDFGESDVGRWRKDPARNAILLYGGHEIPLQFSVEGPRTLRQLDVEGRPIESDLPYELTSAGKLERLELELPLRGMFTYLADAPRFEECLTGRSYPVAMEGAYIELERAYLAADKPGPGAPILAALEGAITKRPAMEGERLIPTVVVRRFIGLFPSQSCERAMSEAALPNTYWRIVKLAGEPVPVVDDRREPHLILRGGESRYAATVGCNQLIGTWDVEGDRLTFTGGASTLMACPPPLDARETKLKSVLADTHTWRINGQVLELFDRTGTNIAVFEAVYLP
ncbi:META domain-containing protein [Lentisalinibacter salinarum]|uniref:META domain-containing protein n=1 Tax=Lentisalinibacter salinarum TaxID=2992239 RepID=UPI0038635876